VQNLHLLNIRQISRLPVHPPPGAQNVTNSAKSVLLAAKAIVNVAHYCCGAAQQLDTEGWDAPALLPSADGDPAVRSVLRFIYQ